MRHLKKRAIVFLWIMLFSAVYLNYSKGEEKGRNEQQRVIYFSGYSWVVEHSTDTTIGPGPNYFSDSEKNVWIDDQGRLHLRITYREGKWYCAKVTMVNSLGYGKYVFKVDSRVDLFQPNVVGGLFTYRNDEEEIDIEFSKWNDSENMDSQFAIQPSYKSENKKRYFLNITQPETIHWFDWQPSYIEFFSIKGHDLDCRGEDNVISHWVYQGDDIPLDKDEKTKINLWLFRGLPVSNQVETEMIISDFNYIQNEE